MHTNVGSSLGTFECIVEMIIVPALQGAALLAAGAAADWFDAVPGDLKAVGLDDTADRLRERRLLTG